MPRDPYQVLGVQRSATAEEIRRAYRRHALRFHPDRNPGREAERLFKEVGEAYDILSDTARREAFDRNGHAQPAAAGAPGVRPTVIVPPFHPGRRARRAAGGPTFSTGQMELGRTYVVRQGGVQLGPVPFHGDWRAQMPEVHVFVPERKRRS